jgi:hypothetical protein
VYLNTSSALALAQCDGTAAEAAAVGISLNAAGIGQPVKYAKHGSTIDLGATTAAGVFYYVSNTAGGVSPVADLGTGDKVVTLGYATATDGTFVVHIINTGASLA